MEIKLRLIQTSKYLFINTSIICYASFMLGIYDFNDPLEFRTKEDVIDCVDGYDFY